MFWEDVVCLGLYGEKDDKTLRNGGGGWEAGALSNLQGVLTYWMELLETTMMMMMNHSLVTGHGPNTSPR